MKAGELAQTFHEAYERLAPSFGYKTREKSAVSWEQVPETNRALMEAVATEVLDALLDAIAPDNKRLLAALEQVEEQRNAAMAGFSSRSQDYHAVAHAGFYTKCQHPLCTGDRAGVDRWMRDRASPKKGEAKP